MRRFLLPFALLLSTPALAQNQYPDPYLLEAADVGMIGAPEISYTLPTLNWTNGGAGDIYSITGASSTALLAAWGTSEARQVSVYVRSWTSGSIRCRMRGGSYVDLGITGPGQSTPVTITSGTLAQTFICTGLGGTTLSIGYNVINGEPAFTIEP